MKLKKAILFSLLVTAGTTAFAQSGNLRKAKSGLQKYQELQEAGSPELGKSNLEDAQEAINQAIEHNKTKDNPETWAVYAMVNANIASLEKSEEAASAAEEGIKKAEELDSDDKQEDNITIARQLLGQYNFNQGVGRWDEQDFENAYTSFDKALTYLPGDTTLTYYSGLAALQSQNYENAIEKYTQLVPETDFSSHREVMVLLPQLYLSTADTSSALDYAAKAVEAYPDDNDAAIQNIELNLVAGNEEKIIQEIEGQIAKDADNKALHYYLGIAHSASNNNEKAKESYKKAVELDPDFIEANKNAAASIMGAVREDLNELNEDKTLSNEDYQERLTVLKDNIQEALPYLEKVVELDPEDADGLRTLRGYYDFRQEEEKSAEIQAKIDALP